MRLATSIENVLRIRNVPTNSAMNAKTSRKVLMKPRAVANSSAASSCSSWPVATFQPSPSSARTSSRSCSALTPSSAAIASWVQASWPRKVSCANSRSNRVRVAPPRVGDGSAGSLAYAPPAPNSITTWVRGAEPRGVSSIHRSSPICQTRLSGILSQPLSNLPFHLAIHSFGTWCGAWVAPGAK